MKICLDSDDSDDFYVSYDSDCTDNCGDCDDFDDFDELMTVATVMTLILKIVCTVQVLYHLIFSRGAKMILLPSLDFIEKSMYLAKPYM